MIASEAAPSHGQAMLRSTIHLLSLKPLALRRILAIWMGFDQALVAGCCPNAALFERPPELFLTRSRLTP